jgi:hypothetical protein
MLTPCAVVVAHTIRFAHAEHSSVACLAFLADLDRREPADPVEKRNGVAHLLNELSAAVTRAGALTAEG